MFVLLWIIIELHKQVRPAYSREITHFLQFVKTIYNRLPLAGLSRAMQLSSKNVHDKSLSSLLQGLNSLQFGLQKQHKKDLFVELCLTVPIRLSSLMAPLSPRASAPSSGALTASSQTSS